MGLVPMHSVVEAMVKGGNEEMKATSLARCDVPRAEIHAGIEDLARVWAVGD